MSEQKNSALKILVAEDDPTIREMLTAMLQKWGYQPLVVADGQAAWEVMQQPDAPELALIDWLMPRLDGLALCRKIRSLGGQPAPYLIMLTSKSSPDDVAKGLEAGADAYLIKPHHPTELHARIRAGIRALEQQHNRMEPIFQCRPDACLPTMPLVLVIEDEPDEAALIRYHLMERDANAFAVHIADSMAKAAGLLAREGIVPDVVVLDLNLPDSAGPAATVGRCRRLCDSPIVVLSGRDENEARRQAIEAGADDFLVKGGDGKTLRRALRYAILRHRRDADMRLAAAVIKHTREGITITRNDGTIIEVNDAFCRITGYRREEVVGQNPRLLKSGRHGREFYTAMWQALSSKGFWSGEIWNKHKDGRVYPELLTISSVPDSTGQTAHYVAIFSDISQLKEQQNRLERMAHYDSLTGLPNRALLTDRLNHAMAQTIRRGARLAVAYLDLDGFKEINDTHGHDVGDQMLCALSQRMKHTLRESDTLGRLGGDEFVAVFQDLPDDETCLPLLQRLLTAAAQPITGNETVLQVSASLGVTFYPQTEEIDADQLLRQADQAMYQAKQAGKNRYHLFDAIQELAMRGHLELLERIKRALVDGEFVLYYQPKVNLRSGQVVGLEALIRWQHPELGLLSPSHFLPAIEDHQLAVALGDWVLEAALARIAAWRRDGLLLPVSVNISARQLQQADFVAKLQHQMAARPEVPADQLELEVVESSALADIDHVSRIIGQCRTMGVGFALDDFGTGYSSLTYLKRLPAQTLKIDRSFVRDMLEDPDDLAILEGVLGLAAAFKRRTVAEGVETAAHVELLLKLGCELAQGYWIAKPMPAAEVAAWVSARQI